MGQEFFIKSDTLESKVRDLLPSQGGLGAGFDLSASTQIIPIVDLTESASGSNLRQDLQLAMSLTSATAFAVNNGTSTIINNTGYFRITGAILMKDDTAVLQNIDINLTDGVTTKKIYGVTSLATGGIVNFDFDKVIFLEAGDSCTVTASASARFIGSTRQIADIDGNLVNP